MLKKWIGDRDFYHRLLALSVPMMIQNGITAFVGMLDNIMVGAVGSEQMTGVAVANQLIFVFQLCIFGTLSGAGLFGAQFSGNSDHLGVRYTFRFKMIFCTAITLAATALFVFCGKPLCNLYMTGESGGMDPTLTLNYAYEYLLIMLIGFLPYSWSQCYASTLREIGRPVPPMAAGIAAVFINLILNYILIFGHFGAPAMGVAGAAVATVISRFAELGIVAVWTHANKKTLPFIQGVYRSLKVPGALVLQILSKGFPLMLNETFWAAGMAILAQCYSVRGLDVVAANNISNTFLNVFSVTFKAVGMAIGIILGQQLGAGHKQCARRDAPKMIVFSVFVSILTGAIFAACAGWIPDFYNTSDTVRGLATGLMLITACTMPLDAYANACYFTLRSGGKILITILFDSAFTWIVLIPVAVILSNFTPLPILLLFATVQGMNLIKCILGGILVKKGIWIRTIVTNQE